MSRLWGAAEGGLLALGLGGALGLYDAWAGAPAPGPPLAALTVLNGSVLLLPGLALGLTRPPRARGLARRLGVLGGWLALALALTAALAQALPRAPALSRAWVLSQPLPPLRVDPGEGPGPVLLLTLDTVRADALDPALLPQLAARAGRGLVYTHALSPSTWTLPAVASVLTGLPPAQHGAGRRVPGQPTAARTALEPGVGTLAERLQDRGYVTLAVLSNPYLGPEHGLDRGLDRLFSLSAEAGLAAGLRRATLIRPWVPPRSDGAEAVQARAQRVLGQAAAGRFFLWVHHLEAHAPYGASGEPCTSPTCFDGWGALRRGEGSLDAPAVRALYAQDLARLDAALGAFFAELDARGLWERALVVLLADHGESFGEHGALEHGSAPWDEQLRVPLVVWAPGRPPGVVDRPVSTRVVYEAVLAWTADGTLGPLEPEAPPVPADFAGSLYGPELAGCVAEGLKWVLVDGQLRVYGPGDTPQDEGVAAPCALEPLPPGDAAPGGWEGLRGLGYVE